MIRGANKIGLLHSSGLALIALVLAGPALAQSALPSNDATSSSADRSGDNAEIVVTGTSIRGVPPAGSNLISVGRATIEETGVQTVQQLLKTIPAVTGLGSAGQGGYNTLDGAAGYAPTIHGLGGVSSNSTLVIIDGHRFPLSGVIRSLGDPNIIPTNAIERVEVVPDGASSTYGSDAVAGVVNFVTRRKFEGVEASAQTGFGDSYRTYDANAIVGHKWDTGFAWVAYDYTNRSRVGQADRSFLNPNRVAQGGSNFANFNCGPASVQPTGSSLIYAAPYSNGVPFVQSNAFCDTTRVTDQIPAERRNSVMLKFEQQIGSRFTIGADAVYSNRRDTQNVSRGSVTALIYGPGSGATGQINPFYTAVGGTATSQTIRMNFDDLLGPGAKSIADSETFYATAHAEYKIGGDWRATAYVLAGVNTSTVTALDQVCGSCALLALNGTTNTNGVTTLPSIVGTSTIVLNTPLTAANALDPYNSGSANRTSAATLAGLIDHKSYQRNRQGIRQYNAKVDGSLFSLPAGKVKLAVGGEFVQYTSSPELSQSLNTGPITQGARFLSLDYSRNVKSAYVETQIPVISPEMNIPLVRRLDINISGRYDDYSDFGSTKNPKFAANWEVGGGLKLRGNIARSFVAPPLGTIGANGMSLDTNFGNFTNTMGQFQVPLDRYPLARQIPGCATATTTCTLGTAAIPGVIINGANPGLTAQKGKTWSMGADYAPRFVPGLTTSLTYWHNELQGGVTSPIPALALNSTGFASLLTIYPQGATAAQLAAFRGYRPQNTVLPNVVYFSYDYRNQNALNLWVEGIDADVHYRHSFGWGYISGGVAGTYKTRFDQQVGAGSPKFSVLNRNRFNSTFPSIRLDLRADMTVKYERGQLAVFVNHTGGFTFWGSTAINPVTVSSTGSPMGGGDSVKALTTVDLNFSYDLQRILPGKTQVFVDVVNLFNRNPPFENTVEGYDTFAASPIGRVVTIGVRTRF